MDKYKYNYLVIKIGGRYFRKLGKRRRILTSWSLPGAKIFNTILMYNNFLNVVNFLEDKKKQFVLCKVILKDIEIVKIEVPDLFNKEYCLNEEIDLFEQEAS